MCTLHCESIITRGTCTARAALSRRSGGYTRRRGRTAAPAAAPAAAAGAAPGRRSGGRSRRSGHQLNAGARDSSRQELTGAKFGVMIWTRIAGSCLGQSGSPADQNNVEVQSNIKEEYFFVKYQ